MNTNAIRDVATKARRQLMEGVERRCLLYDVREGAQRDLGTVGGRVLSASERQQRRELLRLQDDLRGDGKPGSGHAALVEQAAYTWFNRLFAIRFMELNDRLPSHVRMLSAQDGSFAPECLREALDLPMAALDQAEAARLVAEGDDEGLFRLVLLAQCAELAECMPAVFERVGSAMELLLPDALLAKDGIVESLVTGIPEGDWREGVEIVGWAYQFYVSERKDEFFKSKRKAGRDDIAPATQLFTPEYIVRFLVQNSLGRLWVLNNPGSHLSEQMEYFVKPDPEGHEDFRKVASPEEITLIDPACGSGHFLCYAFDLMAAMYEERGYRRRDIPQLILEQNLTGVEIDRRAASLTSFALTMKALEWDGRFLRRGVAPRVVCIEPVELTPEEREVIGAGTEQQVLVGVLAHLGEVGSLWQPTSQDVATIDAWLQRAQMDGGLFAGAATEKLSRAQEYVRVLSDSRFVCATNPPYMTTSNLAPWTSVWMKEQYPDEKGDLCTCFIARGLSLISANGYNAQVTMQSWMFLSSFERMREGLIQRCSIPLMAHLGPRAFDAISGEIVQTVATVFSGNGGGKKGVFIRAVAGHSEEEKSNILRLTSTGTSTSQRFDVPLELFEMIPGSPFAYWLSVSAVRSFAGKKIGDYFISGGRTKTHNNNQYVRKWWEVDNSERGVRWLPYCNGGGYRKWYGLCDDVVDWSARAVENYRSHGGLPNLDVVHKTGISWSLINTNGTTFRVKEKGYPYSSGSPTIQSDRKNADSVALAMLNSSLSKYLLDAINPTINTTVGDVDSIPFPEQCLDDLQVERTVDVNITVCRVDWDSFETSWDFTSHPLVRGARISSAYGLWSAECKDRFDTLKSNEEQLNAIFARIYHMEGEVPIEVEDDKVSVRRANVGRDVRSLLSYAVGCMFGRYSLDKPGLVLANQGDGLAEYLARVPRPRYMPDDDGILPITDDEYFDDDIVAMLCEWLRKAYGPETLEENLRFIADALGGTGVPRKVIRDYFMDQFFADHCAIYSAPSTGKRPIYWLVDSGRLGGFRALVYMHRYTPDLLARVRTDYVHERQERYRSRIQELERQREGASRRELSAIDRELKLLRAQLDEVTKFEERLHHLADQMIEVDLDDGFKANYAKFAEVMAKVK